MREGWKVKHLGDLTEVITKGTTPTSVGFKFEPEGVNFVKVESIASNGVFIENKFAHISAKANESLMRSQLKEGDILFSIAGALGRTAIVTGDILPANTNQALSIIRLKADENVLKRYILAALTSGYALEQIEKFKGGVAQQNLSLGQMKSFQIPIPPLEEQKQIVALLDQAFAAIDQAKANIERNIINAKELFQSKLNEIFSQKGDGWEEKTFQELSSRIGDGLHGTPNYDDSGEYFFINGNNLNDGEIEIKVDTKRVNEEEYNKHLRPLTSNTVLVSINGTLGKVAFYNNEPVILGKSACYINFDERIEKQYIKFLIQSPLFFKNMANESTGATIKNFSLKSMRNYKLLLPPKGEQVKIVKMLQSLDAEIKKLIEKQTKRLMNTDDLKKSILQKAFAGELTNKEVVV